MAHSFTVIRPATCLAVFFLILAEGFSQSRAQQIMEQPSPEKRSRYEGKKFYNPRGGSFTDKKARVKKFHYVDKTRNKTFQTRSFYNGKNGFHGAGKHFSAQKANIDTGKVIVNADREVDTRNVRTRDAMEADRTVEGRAYPYVREAYVRGKSQKAIDQEQAGHRKLSLDEVREILNRNK